MRSGHLSLHNLTRAAPECSTGMLLLPRIEHMMTASRAEQPYCAKCHLLKYRHAKMSEN